MNLRILPTALLATIAAVFWLSAASASATVVITTGTSVYTGTVKAEAEGSAILKGPIEVTCKKSTLEGAVESDGAKVPVKGKLSSLTFSECGTTKVTVVKPGSLELTETSEGDGTLRSTGAEITVLANTIFGTIDCIYATSETHIGTFTSTFTTLDNPTLDISGTIPRTGGSAFCGSTGTWSGSYKVTTPEALVVAAEEQAGKLVKVTPALAFKKENDVTQAEIENITKTIDIKKLIVQLGQVAKDSFKIDGTCVSLNAGVKCDEGVECKTGGKGKDGRLFVMSKDPIVMENTKLTC